MILGIPTWVGGTPSSTPAAVKDFRVGGVVFWVDPADNTHGLVSAIEEQSVIFVGIMVQIPQLGQQAMLLLQEVQMPQQT